MVWRSSIANGAGNSGAIAALESLCVVASARVHIGGSVLTHQEQDADRRERLGEVGTEPECPLCGRPRVAHSDYIRCNPCAVNWLNDEMHLPNYLSSDPRVVRREAARTATATKPTADTLAGDVDKESRIA